MSHILTLAGNPCAYSPLSGVIEYAHRHLRRVAVCSQVLSVRSLPAEALLWGQSDHPAIQDARTLVTQAQGIIVATPVQKTAYAGILKAFLDLLPAEAFRGKVILPVATGCTASQHLMLEYALKPVLAALGANHILDGVYLTEAQIQIEHGGSVHLEENSEYRLHHSLEELVRIVKQQAAHNFPSDWEI